MRQLFLKKENAPDLLVFFAGWGADECLFSRPVPQNHDYMLCFDYRNLDFDHSLLEGYRSIRLIAWSMGVWVASDVFRSSGLPFLRKTAVCGTAFPIDDLRGIPEAVFSGTLRNFSEDTLARFRRRMCGRQLNEFLSRNPYRPADELRDELAFLKSAVESRDAAPDFLWDEAVAGTKDRIFPFANQVNAWKGLGVNVRVVEAEHYDAVLFDNLLTGKEIW